MNKSQSIFLKSILQKYPTNIYYYIVLENLVYFNINLDYIRKLIILVIILINYIS